MHLSCVVRETEEKSDANWAKQRADRRVSRWQPRLAKVRLICQQRDWQSVSVRTRPNLLPASIYTPVVWYIYDQKLESGQNYDDCRATMAYSVCSAHLANVWHNQQRCIAILWEAHSCKFWIISINTDKLRTLQCAMCNVQYAICSVQCACAPKGRKSCRTFGGCRAKKSSAKRVAAAQCKMHNAQWTTIQLNMAHLHMASFECNLCSRLAITQCAASSPCSASCFYNVQPVLFAVFLGAFWCSAFAMFS